MATLITCNDVESLLKENNWKFLRAVTTKSLWSVQGCQTFLSTTYQRSKNIPNDYKIHVPNDHKCTK
jgi:hypothetical protein